MTVKWVDTDKGVGSGKGVQMDIRSRLVARDVKGNDKDRDDLYAETPPLEGKRLLMSRTMTNRKDGVERKMMFIDVRKAHTTPKCEQDVYIVLPDECGVNGEVWCGNLNYWLYGFRPAAAAWEKNYSKLFEEAGFKRGVSCGVILYHEKRDVALVVHGDDFTFSGTEKDLLWVKKLMLS